MLRSQGQNDPYSIYYYWDDPPQNVFDVGEPVWYRHDPTNLPPGAVFQVLIRLRLVPVTQPVSVGVMTDAGTVILKAGDATQRLGCVYRHDDCLHRDCRQHQHRAQSESALTERQPGRQGDQQHQKQGSAEKSGQG